MAFKIVTIGCGSIALRGHGPAYRKYAESNPDVELAACVDIDGDKAEAFRDQFGFQRAYTDMDTALEKEKPDAVCLVVPYQLTAQLAVAILEKGYPLLMEKPPGMTRQETLRMIKAAELSGAPHQVAWNRRYMPVVAYTKQWLSRELSPGSLHNIRYDLNRVNRIGSNASMTMVHGIDMVKYLADSDYKQVRIRYQPFSHQGATESNIHLDCEFESGVWAQIQYRPLSGSVLERVVIDAVNHTMHLHLPFWSSLDAPGKLIHMVNNEIKAELGNVELGRSEEMFIVNGFYSENALFFNDIRAGRKPGDTLKSAMQAVEISEAIRMGRELYVSGEA